MPFTSQEIKKIKQYSREVIIELLHDTEFRKMLITSESNTEDNERKMVGATHAARILDMSLTWVNEHRDELHAEKIIKENGGFKWLFDSSKIVQYMNDFKYKK